MTFAFPASLRRRTAIIHPTAAGTLDRLLGTPAEAPPEAPTRVRTDPAFDRLARLAARALEAPVGLVIAVADGSSRIAGAIWASSADTANATSTADDQALLADALSRHVVASGHPLAVTDIGGHQLTHELLMPEPSVGGSGRGQAFLGLPIVGSDGTVLGSVGVLDSRPRAWSADEVAALGDVAAAAMTELALRDTADDVLRNADPAMYRAKARGKARAVALTPDLHDTACPVAQSVRATSAE